jgi:hypothetical protein
VHAGIRIGRGFLAVQVAWEGRAVFDQLPTDPARILRVGREALRWDARDPYGEARRSVSAVDLPLARALASRLGGELRIEAVGDAAVVREMLLVFPVDADAD